MTSDSPHTTALSTPKAPPPHELDTLGDPLTYTP